MSELLDKYIDETINTEAYSYKAFRDTIDKSVFTKLLMMNRWNITKVAKQLGISRGAFYHRLKSLNMV